MPSHQSWGTKRRWWPFACLSVCTVPLTQTRRAQQHLATTDTCRKLGEGLCPVGMETGPQLTMLPGPRPTFVPSDILIHPTVWPKYINVTARTGQDSGSIAYGEPFYCGYCKTLIGSPMLEVEYHTSAWPYISYQKRLLGRKKPRRQYLANQARQSHGYY